MSAPVSTVRACVLYPSLLNLYADRGNMMILRDRCTWRGIDFELSGVGIGEPLDPDGYDLYYLGGGQDRDQRLCAADLVSTKQDALYAATDRGALILGICGGYQLLGHGYRTDTDLLPGLGLLDVHTVREPGNRLAGNVAIEVDFDGRRVIAGFENHGGRSYLRSDRALGRVLRGHGNNGKDGTEGARGGPTGNVLGTYLHGPLLSANAWLADWLIATALGVDPADLTPLDDGLQQASYAAACRAAGL